MLKLVLGLSATAAVAALLAASPAEAATKRLVGTVGPRDTITLKTPAGRPVRVVPAGVYTIVVFDRADDHNFLLAGPGVRKATGVAATGRVVWRGVRLARGKTYRFWCGPHAAEMRGSFRVR